jgi:hypothetical protein
MEQVIIIGLSVALAASWVVIVLGGLFFKKRISIAHRDGVLANNERITLLKKRVADRDEQFAEVGKLAVLALMLFDQGHFHQCRATTRKILESLAIHPYPAIDDAFMAVDQVVGDCEISPFFIDLARDIKHLEAKFSISQADAKEIMLGVLKNIYTDTTEARKMIRMARKFLDQQEVGDARVTGAQFGQKLNTNPK